MASDVPVAHRMLVAPCDGGNMACRDNPVMISGVAVTMITMIFTGEVIAYQQAIYK